MKKLKLILINIVIFFILLIFSLIALEIYLRNFGKNFQIESTSPFYINSYYRFQDYKIDRDGFFDKDGFRTSEKTKTGSLLVDFYKFNQTKKPQQCSAVIISDSSAFGDGILANQTWPSMFQKKIKCRVFNFSKNGWSSLEMFRFHDDFLKHENYDYLIVGIVANDPHLKGNYDKYIFDEKFHQQKYFIDLLNFQKFPYNLISRIYIKLTTYTDSIYLIDRTINHFLQKIPSKGDLKNPPIIDWGYGKWVSRMENSDYQKIWRDIIVTFNNNNKKQDILYFAAINLNNNENNFYSALTNFFSRNKMKYLYCKDEGLKLKKTFSRKDWANPADAHPGKRNINYFAECLGNYFENKTKNKKR